MKLMATFGQSEVERQSVTLQPASVAPVGPFLDKKCNFEELLRWVWRERKMVPC